MNVPITRRGFLRAGVATTATLAGAGTLAGCSGRTHYLHLVGGERPEVLSVKDLAVLTAIAARVVTPAEGGPTAAEARVARRIDRELAYSDGRLTADVRAALALLEHGPVLDLHLTRFSRLPAADQDAYLESCLGSSWGLRRRAFLGIRFLCLFFYYTDDRTWRPIGYGGPMVDRKLPESANALDALDEPIFGAPA